MKNLCEPELDEAWLQVSMTPLQHVAIGVIGGIFAPFVNNYLKLVPGKHELSS